MCDCPCFCLVLDQINTKPSSVVWKVAKTGRKNSSHRFALECQTKTVNFRIGLHQDRRKGDLLELFLIHLN